MNGTQHDCPFTLGEYRSLLQLAKEHYTFCDFEQFDGDNKVLWRHDLEYSLQEMNNLARIDAQEGIVATIFVQLRSPFYNALSNYSKALFADWRSWGLKVGLHFDWEFFAADLGNLECHLRSEKAKLEELIGVEVRAFSYHNPDDTILAYDGYMAGMVNAYSPAVFSKPGVRYISDSNGRWRNKNLRGVLNDRTVNKLQVNLHDTWWSDNRIPQVTKIEKAFMAEAVWKTKFYKECAAIIVDWIV